MNPSSEVIRDLFRKHCIRCTRQRELVYSALVSTSTHPTAEELLRLVHHHDSALSLATVYNTLDVFMSQGLCRKIASTVATGPCRYDAVVRDHAHGVLPTGEIIDLPNELSHRIVASLSPDLRREVEARVGAKVARVAVEFVLAKPSSNDRDCDDHAI